VSKSHVAKSCMCYSAFPYERKQVQLYMSNEHLKKNAGITFLYDREDIQFIAICDLGLK